MDETKATDSQETPATLDPDFASPTPEPPVVDGAAQDNEIVVSPIEEALGTVTNPTEVSRIWAELAVEEAEFMTSCVRNEGFSGYTERPEETPSADQFAAANGETRIGIEDAAYGVSLTLRGTWHTMTSQVAAGSSPIATYIEQLPATDVEPFKQVVASCRGQARDQFVYPDGLPIALADEIGELRTTALANSSEMQAAISNWVTCMQEGGFDVSSREAAIALVDTEAVEANAFVGQFLGSEAAPTQADSDRFEVFMEPIEQYERQVAGHDLNCATEVGEAEIRTRVLREAENQWLDENLDRIALYLAEQEGS